MFDIGFSEMMVIAVVALVVIGPEKLPRVARTVGAYLGRLQRYVNDVKADINREIELDELRKFKQQMEDTARGFESTVRDEIHKTESEFNQVAQDLAGTSTTSTASTTSTTSAGDATSATGSATAESPARIDSPAGVATPPLAEPIPAASHHQAAAVGAASAPSPATTDAGAKRAA